MMTDSEESSSETSKKETLEKSSRESELQFPSLVLVSGCITFVKKGSSYVPEKQGRLKNSLLVGVGFLELANAGDFAANVWNEIPVPTYAIVLMVIGGSLALSLSYFAFKDARLSLCNLLLLREERHVLRKQKTRHVEDGPGAQDLDTLLSVSFREFGTELISRFGMDALMGFGSVVIGVGTLMAIGGANLHVWQASNLLSGYIGNVPLAFFGLVNAVWSFYVWVMARQHGIAGARALKGEMVENKLRRRVRIVRMYVALSGITGIVAGAGSLIATTMWWGYVILIPVIISSISCNYIWRHWIAYERLFAQEMVSISKASIIRQLEFVASVQRILKETPSKPLAKLVSDSQSTASVVEFLVSNDLFEDFCNRLLCDTHLRTALFGVLEKNITVNSQSLLMVDEAHIPRILEIAEICVSKTGPTHFQHWERYLLDVLGCYLSITQAGTSKMV